MFTWLYRISAAGMPRKGEEYLDHIKKYFYQNYSYEDIRLLIVKQFGHDIPERALKRILQDHDLRRKNKVESPLPDLVVAVGIG